jgi:hypothetical protein
MTGELCQRDGGMTAVDVQCGPMHEMACRGFDEVKSLCFGLCCVHMEEAEVAGAINGITTTSCLYLYSRFYLRITEHVMVQI